MLISRHPSYPARSDLRGWRSALVFACSFLFHQSTSPRCRPSINTPHFIRAKTTDAEMSECLPSTRRLAEKWKNKTKEPRKHIWIFFFFVKGRWLGMLCKWSFSFVKMKSAVQWHPPPQVLLQCVVDDSAGFRLAWSTFECFFFCRLSDR